MLQITNLTKTAVNKSALNKVAKIVLKGENKITKEISVVLVSKEKIQEINKKYRRKNIPTDVLSFEGVDEIFICPELIKKGEMNFILIHGILHLLGYDHKKGKKQAKKMEKKEKYYLSKIEIPDHGWSGVLS